VWQISAVVFPPPAPRAPAAGWYEDPHRHELLRWWDGRSWTPYTAPDPSISRHRDDIEPPPTLTLSAAVGALMVLATSLIGSRFLLDQLIRFDWPIAVYALVSGLVGYGPALLWCWFASRRWGRGRFREDIGLRIRWSDAGWGPLTWIAAVTAQVAVAALVIGLGIPTSNNTDGIDEVGADRSYVISLLVLAVVAAPIVEEIVFRGVVLRGFLSVMPAIAAVGLQGVLFGLAHVDPVRGWGNIGLALILSAVGVVLGISAYLLRRIAAPMIAHAILNAVVMVVVLTGVA
jgi:uncharacterized protein